MSIYDAKHDIQKVHSRVRNSVVSSGLRYRLSVYPHALRRDKRHFVIVLSLDGQSVLYSLGRIQHRMAKAHINLIFRAFSDRTRLRILCLLTHDEMCVGDLVKVLQVPQPTASRHLSYLRRAGLVETRKNGLWVHYRLAPARTAFHRNILKCLGNCFQDVPEIADDAKRAGLVRKSGGCCPV